MYLWNVNRLAEELRSGNLSEKQKLMYFLVYLSLLLASGAFTEATSVAMRILGVAIAIIIQLITTAVCYQANSRGDDKNFLERYICLQVPMTIRFWVLGSVVGVLFVIVFGNVLFHMPRAVFTLTSYLLIIGAYWVYIAYLRAVIAKVAALPPAADLTGGN